MRFYIENYGCTFNKSDGDFLAAEILNKGGLLTESIRNADIIIINSCGVKDATERRIIERIKNIKKNNPEKLLILTGCLPIINKKEIKNLEEKYKINVVGLDYSKLKKILDEINGIDGKDNTSEEARIIKLNRLLSVPIARIPACEGCLSKCSFCATKFARGNLKSFPPELIVGWIETAVKNGAKEIQLTGQDLGCYGLDINSSLSFLLKKISKMDGDFKVRIGMINPIYIKNIPSEIFESEKFYRFLHLPIQSGSNKVLRDMRRPYKIDKVIDFINGIREKYNLTFETDIIVGFPTEDEEDFLESLNFISTVKPDVVNVSKFGARPNTEASKMKQLSNKIIKERSKKMADLCRKVSLEKNKEYIGKMEEVLILEYGKNNSVKGRTNNYKQVVLRDSNITTLGSKVKVRIKSANCTSLFADVFV